MHAGKRISHMTCVLNETLASHRQPTRSPPACHFSDTPLFPPLGHMRTPPVDPSGGPFRWTLPADSSAGLFRWTPAGRAGSVGGGVQQVESAYDREAGTMELTAVY